MNTDPARELLDPALSHTRGESEPPLPDQTIPDNLVLA